MGSLNETENFSFSFGSASGVAAPLRSVGARLLQPTLPPENRFSLPSRSVYIEDKPVRLPLGVR